MADDYIVPVGDLTGKKLRTRTITENEIKKEDQVVVAMGASGFQTNDAHATPKTSPLTVGATEIVITVPSNAIEFDYGVENYPIRVSEVAGMARYNKVQVGGDKFGCAGMNFIYVKRDGGDDATLHFRFNTI